MMAQHWECKAHTSVINGWMASVSPLSICPVGEPYIIGGPPLALAPFSSLTHGQHCNPTLTCSLRVFLL